MKFIKHEDLCAIIPCICDKASWSLSDFEKLLNKFGDDWYIDDGAWQCVEKNENMEAFRQKSKVKNDTTLKKNKENDIYD